MKFAVFILSHKRADRVETYDTLRNSGYTGDLFVVVDNEDADLCKYIDRFGDNLKIFNKKECKQYSDTVTNEKLDSSPVYARNYIEILASLMSLDAYIVMDDDVKNLRYRYIDGDIVRSVTLTQNIDKVFDLYISYMVKCNIFALSFSHVMLYVGGVNGIEKKISENREMYQIHMRNMNFNTDWISLANNDTITELVNSRLGRLLWSLPFIIYDSPKMNTLPGGMKSIYDSVSDFRRAFMATVVLPSVCRPIVSHNRFIIGRNKKSAYPMVISGRYKK